MTQDFNATRRRMFQGAGAIALAGLMPALAGAQSKQIVVSDPGGPYTAAYRNAFYDPFEKATGIKVISVARESQPVAQLSAMVQTRNYVWDVTTLTLSADIPYLESKGYLEPIGMKASDYPDLMPEAVTANWLGSTCIQPCSRIGRTSLRRTARNRGRTSGTSHDFRPALPQAQPAGHPRTGASRRRRTARQTLPA